MNRLLPILAAEEISVASIDADSDAFRAQVRGLVAAVAEEGDGALRRLARRYDGLGPDDRLVRTSADLEGAYRSLPRDQQALLERCADRIRTFARAQRRTALDLTVDVPGGQAGHRWRPVDRAGCYAPGGRYPLPSSALMTVIPAVEAGVQSIWLASPRPGPVVLAAAHVAGAEAVLAAGGAQAVAALAYGTESVPRADVIVGPGNRWVTAAKQLVAGRVGIDMPAGPSELVVVADASAQAEVIAADLLAQAEHDVEARVGLITLEAELAASVERALERQLLHLPTAETARAALEGHGFACVVDSVEEAARVSDRLAPEHLHLQLAGAREHAAKFTAFGGLFIGEASAEVFGDYGLGPNHTLPTGGAGRFRGGLSVFDFLVCRTWLTLDDPSATAGDMAALGRIEGLEAHARSADARRGLKGA